MGIRDLFEITGRTALITGGSRGLGLQVAEALAEMGAQIALLARKRDELDRAVDHLIRRFGGKAIGEVCDVMDTASIAPAVERAITALGPIDILVNNAGATWGAATLDHPLDAWRKVVDVNLTGM